MNREEFKEMMKQLLHKEKEVYKMIINIEPKKQPYKEMIIAIDRIISHIDKGYYDNEIEIYCNHFEDEILKEADEEIQKSKKRTKKKAE